MKQLTKDEQKEHLKVIEQFLKYLNEKSNEYILKGGSALKFCYGNSRMTQDIDLDSINHETIKKIIPEFCKKYNYQFRIAKDINTVQRYFINYGNIEIPLKIEISFRNKDLSEKDCERVNGYRVYNIDKIGKLKAIAYSARDKIRDLYDVCFIINNYEDKLKESKDILSIALANKGLENFDYLSKNEVDHDLDLDELAESFLIAIDKVGIIFESDDEKKIFFYKKKQRYNYISVLFLL